MFIHAFIKEILYRMRKSMNNKGRYLKLILLISAVIVVSVLCTMSVMKKMVSTMSYDVEVMEENVLTDGIYDNADILSCSDGKIIFKWNGKEYEYSGVLEKDYIGKADIEVKNHKIVCVKIKKEKIHLKEESKTIGVVLKNGNSIYYDDVYIRSDGELKNNGKKIGKKEIDVASYMKKKKVKEININGDIGKLYISMEGGQTPEKGYEGELSIYKKDSGYVVVNRLEIEDYLRYVLPSEMPVSFSKEALKAQAVCARTFAYAQIKNKNYAEYQADLDDSTAFQVYNASGNYDVTDEAVRETSGQVITYDGELVQCYYFSTCPGKTEDMEVWAGQTPGYIHKVASKDKNSPFYAWCAKLNLKQYYDQEYGKLKSISVEKTSKEGYVLQLIACFEKEEVTFEKENDIRFFLGKYLEEVTLQDGTIRKDLSAIPSACFSIEGADGTDYILKGGGFGHGIGLSQYGANQMAQKGKQYKDIIKYYYNDVKIHKIEDVQ